MSQSRRRLCWIGLVLVVIALTFVLADPTSRSVLWGVLRGESFYRGKPTNYWGGLIHEQHNIEFYLSPPRLSSWNWLERQRRTGGKRIAELDRLVQPLVAGDAAAVRVLSELLDHEDEVVRVTATQGLGMIGPAAKDSTLTIARGLSDTAEVQEKSFQALGALGPSARPAVPALKAIIRAKPGQGPAFAGYKGGSSYTDKWPRIAAATILWRIAPEDEDILPPLLDELNDRKETDIRLRIAAIETLGAIGPRAQAAVPRLLEEIKTSDNGYCVEQATKALQKIDPEAAAKVGK